MKSHVLHTGWRNIFGEAAGKFEINTLQDERVVIFIPLQSTEVPKSPKGEGAYNTLLILDGSVWLPFQTIFTGITLFQILSHQTLHSTIHDARNWWGGTYLHGSYVPPSSSTPLPLSLKDHQVVEDFIQCNTMFSGFHHQALVWTANCPSFSLQIEWGRKLFGESGVSSGNATLKAKWSQETPSRHFALRFWPCSAAAHARLPPRPLASLIELGRKGETVPGLLPWWHIFYTTHADAQDM